MLLPSPRRQKPPRKHATRVREITPPPTHTHTHRYLADVTKISSGAQTALLYVFMVFGVWGLTVFNLRVQKMPAEKKNNNVRLDFIMEVPNHASLRYFYRAHRAPNALHDCILL